MTSAIEARPCRRCAADWRNARRSSQTAAIALLMVGGTVSLLYVVSLLGWPIPHEVLVVQWIASLPASYVAYLLLILIMAASGRGFASSDGAWLDVVVLVGASLLQYGTLARLVLLPRMSRKDRQRPSR